MSSDIVRNFQIQRNADTKQIVLPKDMTCRQAIECLEKKEKEDETKIQPHHTISCFPLDGAVNFHRALSETYGWTELVPTPGFFGGTPPTLVGIPVSLTETVTVPWGRLCIPGVNGYLETGLEGSPAPSFYISGQIQQKHANEVLKIYELTVKNVREKSVYKGKAIKLSFAWQRNGERFHPIQHAPRFIDLVGVKPQDLVFCKEVQDAIDQGLFTPITQSKACRMVNTSLKRGVLLEGKWGTGKTLTANVTALLAVQNGWTFIHLESVEDLAKGLAVAAQYTPSVLFVEDIDRALNSRTLSTDAILNTLDGVDTKKAEIITVMTTNDVNAITQAMLRPGRIDVAVSVKPPDAEAAIRLVKLYGSSLLEKSANYEKLGAYLAGKIPAHIREVIDRAKLATISRLAKAGVDVAAEGITGKVTEKDLLTANASMEMHHQLLKPREKERTMAEQFGDILGTRLGESVSKTVNKLASKFLTEAMKLNEGNAIDLDVLDNASGEAQSEFADESYKQKVKG